jgi:hypothetical protein
MRVGSSTPSPEQQAIIDKAELPEGCTFEEAFQRLCTFGMTDDEAEHWALILAPRAATS